nr:unnamed protein product [Digitaria exilis]
MAASAPATAGELLRIEPLELRFPFELKKQISCSMQLSNLSNDYIAFKVGSSFAVILFLKNLLFFSM